MTLSKTIDVIFYVNFRFEESRRLYRSKSIVTTENEENDFNYVLIDYDFFSKITLVIFHMDCKS